MTTMRILMIRSAHMRKVIKESTVYVKSDVNVAHYTVNGVDSDIKIKL